MNVDKTSSTSFIQAYQRQIQLSKVEKTKPVQNEDKVQISTQAKQLFEKDTELNIDRQEKIKSLKEQIQSGNYQVDSKAVAEKVYQFWFDK